MTASMLLHVISGPVSLSSSPNEQGVAKMVLMACPHACEHLVVHERNATLHTHFQLCCRSWEPGGLEVSEHSASLHRQVLHMTHIMSL